MFRKMRRKNCELSAESAEKILREGIFGVLSLLGDENYCYGVPLNYAVEDNKIYFHSAKSGHKLDAIKNNDKVSFCVVDSHEVVAEEFTSYFTSAIAFGKIKVLDDSEVVEKHHALELLADKYCLHASAEMREKELSRVNAVSILVLEIENLTGKAARELIRDKKIS